ncbi:MAG: hypothetical protein GWO20_09335 [Candidatus Korarchaeota archaeon]|nr:hypothetical protein [Candidatus Korarchaeota archaeon]NIU83636.1 hypothetical protein [Candidatus Thorarchaeota archaeon]NIW13863.1 hypothetical protein [Candidatus Thorarchaeota archaeon]NIW51974.1 hypothetical protein [Candidatus Korarchaeota archaeon]
MNQKTKITILLSLLSLFFGEIISGSTPPLDFTDPLLFLFFWSLYGSGVLLMRELWVRWGQEYSQLMVLGILYGIIKEGIASKSFFNLAWVDLDSILSIGMSVGVTFAWVIWLSIFHAVFSITLPILLIHTIYPECKEKPFFSDAGLKGVLIIFLSVVVIIFFFLSPSIPPILPYIVTLGVTVYLVKKAKEGITLKKPFIVPYLKQNPMIFGITFTFTMFFLFFLFPNSILGVTFPIILVIFFLLNFYERLEDYSRLQQFRLVIGLLLPLLLFFDVLMGVRGSIGLALTGILTFIVLIRQYLKEFASEQHENRGNVSKTSG